MRWAGSKLHASCPFARWKHKHGNDSSPSFAIYRTPMGGLRYNCLACGSKGKLIGLLWRIRAYTKQLHEEAMFLVYDAYLDRMQDIPAKRLDYRIGGSTVGDAIVRVTEEYEPGTAEMPTGETEMLWEDMDRGRGANYQKPEEWEVERYQNDPTPEILEKASAEAYETWGLGYDIQKRRWMFPCRNREGELVGMTGRLMWDKEHCFRCGHDAIDRKRTAKKREAEPDAGVVYVRKCKFCGTAYTKYWHMPGPWRRDALYGVHLYEPGRPLVVVEGSTDVIHLWDLGVRCPGGIFGNQLNPSQVDLIVSLEPPKVFVMGDGDKGGELLNKDLAAALKARSVPHEVVPLPPGVDPGEMTLKMVEEPIPSAIGD